MGLLSPSVSITRYRVEGKLEDPVIETVTRGLKKYILREIDKDEAEKTSGWTSFNNPFKPDCKANLEHIYVHPAAVGPLRSSKEHRLDCEKNCNFFTGIPHFLNHYPACSRKHPESISKKNHSLQPIL